MGTGPTCLVPVATSRAIRWAVRRMANGGSKRMSCASIAARMKEAAARCGCPERMVNSEGQACRLLSKEFCSRPRPVIDLSGFTRVREMKTKATTIQFLVLGCSLFATSDALAVEQFKRISGPQIRVKVSGMEMTDEVHWRDAYQRDGSFKSRSMGRTRTGKWQVRKDELCVDVGPGTESGCYEVWISGNAVQLKPTGLGLPLEGVLQKPNNAD